MTRRRSPALAGCFATAVGLPAMSSPSLPSMSRSAESQQPILPHIPYSCRLLRTDRPGLGCCARQIHGPPATVAGARDPPLRADLPRPFPFRASICGGSRHDMRPGRRSASDAAHDHAWAEQPRMLQGRAGQGNAPQFVLHFQPPMIAQPTQRGSTKATIYQDYTIHGRSHARQLHQAEPWPMVEMRFIMDNEEIEADFLGRERKSSVVEVACCTCWRDYHILRICSWLLTGEDVNLLSNSLLCV